MTTRLLIAILAVGAMKLLLAQVPTPMQVDPANGVWALVLNGGVAAEKDGKSDNRPLALYLGLTGGVVKQTHSTAPKYNTGRHIAVGEGLSVDAGVLKGRLIVTIFPDAWVPADRKTTTGEYVLDAAAKNGVVTGTYTGTFAGHPVAGTISGTVTARRPVEDMKLSCIIENGIDNVPSHIARVLFSCRMVKGTIEDARAACYDPLYWRARIRRPTLTITHESFTATVPASVISGRYDDAEGDYVFTIEGQIVGDIVFGTVTRTQDGQALRARAYFVGKVE